ncbi:helix-turn-helix domain-containing protein [Micromonospora sp. FIMYZ51]|uniref:helix-turn-helix domain-containing protein n=1 Tax=Micromonospora sp. FIMYZ51 TaxID=3051832 RepID=UPI00311DDAD1
MGRAAAAARGGAGGARRTRRRTARPAGAAGGSLGERYAASLADRAAADAATVLVAVAAHRLRVAGGPDRLGSRVAAALSAGAPVAATAAEVGLDPRGLLRRSRHLFGYGPKTLARILRMRRALALARGGTPLAEVAARTGYADQAHLTRDVRALAGVPPGALLTS